MKLKNQNKRQCVPTFPHSKWNKNEKTKTKKTTQCPSLIANLKLIDMYLNNSLNEQGA